MNKLKVNRALPLLRGAVLLIALLLSPAIQAQDAGTRSYKISVIIFKHFPTDKNTAPRMIPRWTEKTFADSALVTPSNQSSELQGAYRALMNDKSYSVLYNNSWVTELPYGEPRSFHLHTIVNENNILDGLINITLKYNLDVHFQTQLLSPSSGNFYAIDALDESYQTPSNQLQYIDGPIYGALIKITRYNNNTNF